MAANAVTLLGITTIVWGTPSGLAPVSGAIVKSCKITPVGGKIGSVENGDGAEVMAALLDDGFDAEVTCELDTAKTWPELGDVISAFTAPENSAKECLVVNNPIQDLSLQRKQSGEIVIKLQYRPGIDLTP